MQVPRAPLCAPAPEAPVIVLSRRFPMLLNSNLISLFPYSFPSCNKRTINKRIGMGTERDSLDDENVRTLLLVSSTWSRLEIGTNALHTLIESNAHIFGAKLHVAHRQGFDSLLSLRPSCPHLFAVARRAPVSRLSVTAAVCRHGTISNIAEDNGREDGAIFNIYGINPSHYLFVIR
jgi:hypothetical protein